MEDLIQRLRRLSNEYEMYSDAYLKDSIHFKLKAKYKHEAGRWDYGTGDYNSDLEFSRECEIKAGVYWNIRNEIELILKRYDLPIDFVI